MSILSEINCIVKQAQYHTYQYNTTGDRPTGDDPKFLKNFWSQAARGFPIVDGYVADTAGRIGDKVLGKIPQRAKDHALNVAAQAEKGFWDVAHGIIPNTPKYIASLAGGLLGGINGALGGKREAISGIHTGNNSVDRAINAIRTPIAIATDTINGAAEGADAFKTILDEKYSKPVEKWQDILFPALRRYRDLANKTVDDLGAIRKEQDMDGNPYAREDFQASKIISPSVGTVAAAPVLGKVTNGFGAASNALHSK